MAFTCKTLRDAVTTPMVVKSAMIQGGGGARDCMRTINDLMVRQEIHVPSPLRLLRLVNCKRCEFCNVTKLVPSAMVWRLGVFACRACLEDRMVVTSDPAGKDAWMSTWSKVAYHDIALPHPRVMRWHNKVKGSRSKTRAHLWKERTTTAAIGEAVGPLISFEELTPFLAIAKEHSGVTAGDLDEYFAQELKIPTAEAYKEFIEVYAENRARSNRIVAEREVKKRATAQKNKDSRQTKVKKMISSLATFLDESFRDAALMTADTSMVSARVCVKFTSPFVDNLLNPYVRSPSKVSKKILVEIANTINGKFRLIESKGFLNMDAFSGTDTFEVAVKRSFGQKYSSYDALVQTTRLDERFFDLLQQHRIIAALAYFEKTYFHNLLLPADLDWRDKPRLTELAYIVWKSKLDDCGDKDDDDGRFRKIYAAGSDLFVDAQKAVDGYTLWLQEKHPDMDYGRKEYAIREAHENSSYLPDLLARAFQRLHDSHEKFYQDDIWFNF